MSPISSDATMSARSISRTALRLGVGAFGNEEIGSARDLGGIRNRDGDAPGAEQMPQPYFTADAVAVGVDVRGQNDVAGTRRCRRHVAGRLGASRRTGTPLELILDKIIACRAAPAPTDL